MTPMPPRRLIPLLVAVLAAGPARADYVPGAAFYASATTGFTTPFGTTPPWTAEQSGVASAAATMDGFLGSANAYAAVGDNGKVALGASASGTSVGLAHGTSSAAAKWADQLRLTAPPGTHARNAVAPVVRLAVTLAGRLMNAAGVSLSINGGVKLALDQSADGDTDVGPRTLVDDFTPTYDAATGQFVYDVGIDLRVTAGGPELGTGSADFGHTAVFDSLTVTTAGGVTPESLGWKVEFASGVASPNPLIDPTDPEGGPGGGTPPAAVPVPPSAALFGLGAAGLAWFRRQRAGA